MCPLLSGVLGVTVLLTSGKRYFVRVCCGSPSSPATPLLVDAAVVLLNADRRRPVETAYERSNSQLAASNANCCSFFTACAPCIWSIFLLAAESPISNADLKFSEARGLFVRGPHSFHNMSRSMISPVSDQIAQTFVERLHLPGSIPAQCSQTSLLQYADQHSRQTFFCSFFCLRQHIRVVAQNSYICRIDIYVRVAEPIPI